MAIREALLLFRSTVPFLLLRRTNKSYKCLPIEDGDGADDCEKVEDALERLRERRVERDEVEGAGIWVGGTIIGEDVHLQVHESRDKESKMTYISM